MVGVMIMSRVTSHQEYVQKDVKSGGLLSNAKLNLVSERILITHIQGHIITILCRFKNILKYMANVFRKCI